MKVALIKLAIVHESILEVSSVHLELVQIWSRAEPPERGVLLRVAAAGGGVQARGRPGVEAEDVRDGVSLAVARGVGAGRDVADERPGVRVRVDLAERRARDLRTKHRVTAAAARKTTRVRRTARSSRKRCTNAAVTRAGEL